MKKKLMVLLIALMVAMLVVSPVIAGPAGKDGPPGWSIVNPGVGGSDTPGTGIPGEPGK
jgi:hypothetical protein